jgi:hypothetical protein
MVEFGFESIMEAAERVGNVRHDGTSGRMLNLSLNEDIDCRVELRTACPNLRSTG